MVTILDVDGNPIETFGAGPDSNLAGQANEHGCNIPLACCSWACLVCTCEIVKGQEYIDRIKFGEELAEIPENQVLTCIAWIKDECFTSSEKLYEVTLRKLM